MMDTSIGQFITDINDRPTLKEVPVNGKSSSSSAPVFKRIDGDFPKLPVDLYEQMVYHRDGSTNKNPLEIFIPTRYKIIHDKINQYFGEKSGDEGTKDIVANVIQSYGKNNNSLFYKHTLAGKANSGTLDLDEKARGEIQDKIVKWHNDYAGWVFYDNASMFFIQNKDIPQDELFTLKVEIDEVFKGDGNAGIVNLVDNVSSEYTKIRAKYTDNGADALNIITETVTPYVTFFKSVFKDIKNHMNDQLNFITNRKENMDYSYEFNDTIKASLFKTYEELKTVLENLGDMTNVSYLQILPIVNTFKKEISDRNKSFPLKTVFDDYILNQKKITKYPARTTSVYNNDEINRYLDEIGGTVAGTGADPVLQKFIREKIYFNDDKGTGKIAFNFSAPPPSPRAVPVPDIDILFYLLYRATITVVSEIMKNPKVFEKIDETKDAPLRKIRQEIDLNEKKLKNVCDLIAKISGFPVERIIPDQTKYYDDAAGGAVAGAVAGAGAGGAFTGFISPTNYTVEWGKILDVQKKPGSDIAFAITKMKKKLDKSVGLDISDEGQKKTAMNRILSLLIEHNTVQVLNMMFAKPRFIAYSPSLRIKTKTSMLKWGVFQLDRPKIISKRAFRQFNITLTEPEVTVAPAAAPAATSAPAPAPSRLDSIREKNKDITIDVSDNALPFCIFIISSEPGPQILPPGKDSTNDTRLENDAFVSVTGAAAAGEKEAGKDNFVDDSSVIGAFQNQFNKIFPFKKPSTENCANARGQIGNAFNEMTDVAAGAMKEIGVDIEKKIKAGFPANADDMNTQSTDLNQQLQDELERERERERNEYIDTIIKDKNVSDIIINILDKDGIISSQEYRTVAIALCKYSSDLTENVFKTNANNILSGANTDKCKVTDVLPPKKLDELKLLISKITDIKCEYKNIADEATGFNDILDVLRENVSNAVDNGQTCGNVLYECFISLLNTVKSIPGPALPEIPPLLPPPPPSPEELSAHDSYNQKTRSEIINKELQHLKEKLSVVKHRFTDNPTYGLVGVQIDRFKILCEYAVKSIQKYSEHANMVNETVSKIPPQYIKDTLLSIDIDNISKFKTDIEGDKSSCEKFKIENDDKYKKLVKEILEKTKLSFNYGLQCSQSITDGAKCLDIIYRKKRKSPNDDTNMSLHIDSIKTLNNSNGIFNQDIQNIENLLISDFFSITTNVYKIQTIIEDIFVFNDKITQMVKLYEEVVQIYKKNIQNILVGGGDDDHKHVHSVYTGGNGSSVPPPPPPPPPHPHPPPVVSHTPRRLPHELITYYRLNIKSLFDKIQGTKNEFDDVDKFTSRLSTGLIPTANKDNLRKAYYILKTLQTTIMEMAAEYTKLCEHMNQDEKSDLDDDIKDAQLKTALINVETILKKGGALSKEAFLEFCKYAQLNIDNIYKPNSDEVREYSNGIISSLLTNFKGKKQDQVLLNIINNSYNTLNTIESLQCKPTDFTSPTEVISLISEKIIITSKASTQYSKIIFDGSRYISMVCESYYNGVNKNDQSIIDSIGKGITENTTSGVFKKNIVTTKYTGKLEQLNGLNEQVQKLIQDTDNMKVGRLPTTKSSKEETVQLWLTTLKNVNEKLASMYDLYNEIKGEFEKVKDKFNSIDDRRIAEAKELAEIAAHGPPPLPPIPPSPPREKTHEDYINEATILTSKAHIKVTSNMVDEPENYDYMKKLCNYAKVSIEHIYRVHSSLVYSDINKFDPKIRYALQLAKTEYITEIHKIQNILNTITISKYCVKFKQTTGYYPKSLRKILKKIKKTFEYGIKSSTTLTNGINCLDYIIERSIVSVSDADQKRMKLLLNVLRVLKESNDKFERDIIGTPVLVRSSVLMKTPSEELKKLFTNLKQLNDNLAIMAQNYNSFKQIFDKYKVAIIARLPDVPPPTPPIPPPLPPVPPTGVSSGAGGPAAPPPPGPAPGHPHGPTAAPVAGIVSGQPPPPPPPPAAASAPPAVPVAFLQEIKRIITQAATALYQVTIPPPPPPSPLNIPQLTFTPPSSADFKDIARLYLQDVALYIQQKFKTHISETTEELNSKLGKYNDSKKELIENVKHCTYDPFHGENLDEIGDDYNALIQTYKRYNTQSEYRYNSIVSLVGDIIDTGIDQPQRQIDTRTLFQTLRGNCIAFAEFITEHMKNLEDDVLYFNNYVTNKIPDLTKRLIACINRSIDVTTTEIVSGHLDIKFDKLVPSFNDGDSVIGEISGLLDELAKLEAAD